MSMSDKELYKFEVVHNEPEKLSDDTIYYIKSTNNIKLIDPIDNSILSFVYRTHQYIVDNYIVYVHNRRLRLINPNKEYRIIDNRLIMNKR